MAGSINGYVKDDSTLTPVAGARVLQYNPRDDNNWVTSATDGFYTILIPINGNITLRTTRSGYYTKDVTVAVNNNTVTQDILIRKQSGGV